MTEQEARIEQLEMEVEILKKRVDFFYNEIRPTLQRESCKHKYVEVDNNGQPVSCYLNHPCTSCEYYKETK